PTYFFPLALAALPSIMPSTSSSRRIRYSWPSSLISAPEYLPKRIRSPAFTSRAITFPSSVFLPFPTATTSPSWGFSLAVSGIMIPPFTASFSSIRLIRIRSCRGLKFILTLLITHELSSNYGSGLILVFHLRGNWHVGDLSKVLASAGLDGPNGRHTNRES